MSRSSSSILVQSGLESVIKKKIKWKIDRFDEIVKNSKLIEQQEFKLDLEETDGLPSSSWTLGLIKLGCHRNVISVTHTPNQSSGDFPDSAFVITQGSISDESGNKLFEKSGVPNFDVFKCQSGPVIKFGILDFDVESWEQRNLGALLINVTFEICRTSKPLMSVSEKNWLEKFRHTSRRRDSWLLYNEELSDVKIIAKDGQIFRAHKLILRARNEVFNGMFRCGMRESQSSVIRLDDMSSNAVEFLLNFIYSSNVLPFSFHPENVDDESETPRKRPRLEPTDNRLYVDEVLYAAEKYGLDDLRDYVNQKMKAAFDVGNALYLLQLCKKYSLDSVNEVKKFIKNHPNLLDKVFDNY